MIDFGFNEVCGLPVSFDEKINDSTKCFGVYVSMREDDYYHWLGPFDNMENGKWVSVMLEDEYGSCIEFDSMRSVVEALINYFKIHPKYFMRRQVDNLFSVHIDDDTPEPWYDED